MTEVLIVGAGPAGLAAAVAARRRGAQVRILDAAERAGGQYWRHPPALSPDVNEKAMQHQWQTFVRLREALQHDPGVTFTPQAQVWAIEPGDGPRVNVIVGMPDGGGRHRESIVPDRLVLATGAHDRALPVPGWTLPGVVTAGAAQALAKGERLAIGRRVVVAGAGPFLLPVAAALREVGARVVGVFEATRPTRLARQWLRRPWQLVGVGHKAPELAGYVAGQLRHRVPYHAGQGVIAVHGDDCVRAVTVALLDQTWTPIAGTERRLDCDAVCLGHGFVPRLELALAAGCGISAEGFIRVDDAQWTSVDGVLAAGEITAIGGADAALAEGEIAGWIAAGGELHDPAIRRVRRTRDRLDRFAARLAAAHPVGDRWTSWLTEDTLVCRCEEVDFGTLRRVADQTQSVGLRSLKLTTRAGLGLCQGRVCGRSVEHILGGPDLAGTTDRRPIVVPLRVSELARGVSPPSQSSR